MRYDIIIAKGLDSASYRLLGGSGFMDIALY